MTVYFITEFKSELDEPFPIKIGYSQDVRRRISTFQTGNSDELALMGIIKTSSREGDKQLERKLHDYFAHKKLHGEWFNLNSSDVIDALQQNSSDGFIVVGSDPFEIVSFDHDGLPEFAGPWQWGDVDVYTFCPSCGWAGGWSYNENCGGERCLKCGASGLDYEVNAFHEG